MKKNILILLVSIFSIKHIYGQTGIKTATPQATLDVMGDASIPSSLDGIIPPKITGDVLKSLDGSYGTNQAGAIVYVTAVPTNPVTAKTTNIKNPGYYYYDAPNTIWVEFQSTGQTTANDATRFLGGTVYVRFNNQSNGTLINGKLISGTYSLGQLTNQTPSKGGINSVAGNGYTVSNPAQGIFDIKFDTAFTQLYGVVLNIEDVYGYNSDSSNSTVSDINPNPSTPGSHLRLKDNTQVAYLSNSIIRVKTGDNNGALSNRTFSFIITGK